MDDIFKIKIKGDFFKDGTELIFQDEDRKIKDKNGILKKPEEYNKYKSVIIYGQNGSGKSSICNSILKFTSNSLGQEEYVIFENEFNKTINITDDQKAKIYIYNENIVDFNNEGLKTIVMFAEQKEIDEKIKGFEIELKKIEDDRTNQNILFEKNNDINSINNPYYHFAKIKKSILSDSGWAKRDGIDIKKNQRKTSTSDEFVKSLILKFKPVDNIKKTISLYKKELSIHEKINEKSEKIVLNLDSIKYNISLFNSLNKLLEKEFKSGKYNERETKILELIKKESKQNFYIEVKETFINKDIEECPFCLQEVKKDYKENLIASISKILNPEVEKFQKKLNKMQDAFDIIDNNIKSINLNLINYQHLFYNEYLEINKIINIYNNEFSNLKKIIASKLDNPYISVQYDFKEMNNIFKNINLLIKKLNKSILEYNENIDGIRERKEYLNDLNEIMFFSECQNDIENYFSTLDENDRLKNFISDLEKDIFKLKENIKELQIKKKNIGIALKKINDWLGFIFMSKNRIQVEYDDELAQYVVKSNDENIPLKKLSTGEKNIIALCYYFSNIMSNCTIENIFKDEVLLFLDDPISSFDYNNKIGIYSFFRMIFEKIIKSNDSSKIIIFTHSTEVSYALNKVFSDFTKTSEIINKKLVSKKLINYNVEKENEYRNLLNDVYNYSISVEEDLSNRSIGNTIRKILEAYGTFNYRVGISEISTDDLITSKIPLEKREYFKNSMFRLVLHGDSHLEQKSKNLVDQDLFYNVSYEEKKKTSKDVLMLLYLLDNVHLLKYFKDNEKIISQIEKWINETFKTS